MHCYLEIERIKNIILVTEKKGVINNYEIETDGINECMKYKRKDEAFIYTIKNVSHRILLSDISFLLLFIIRFFFN